MARHEGDGVMIRGSHSTVMTWSHVIQFCGYPRRRRVETLRRGGWPGLLRTHSGFIIAARAAAVPSLSEELGDRKSRIPVGHVAAVAFEPELRELRVAKALGRQHE